MFQIDNLCALASTYLEPEQVKQIQQAHKFGEKAHKGQKRRSGEDYIFHPLAVAGILAEMHMDHQTLIAALLHDVIEDTKHAKEEINETFGSEVAEIVDGVSKLTQMHFDSPEEQQAQNFRKMIMAMAEDIRVILVKLADRLHNMRTLGVMPPEKRRAKARETLDIYIPIAQRLGMNKMRLELEDLGFAAYHPMRYRVIKNEIKKARGHRKEIVKQIKQSIKRRLRQEKMSARVVGREKHMYSIYRKMRQKDLPFDEVYDMYAFRIVVGSVDMCYRVLGAMHNLYKPLPGKFKDYISIPKANGYQSLHTVLFGPYGVPIEVQIRTKEMDDVAERGIAAHWLYKTEQTAGNSAHQRARNWMQRILEMQQQAGNSEEFLEHVKIDLFPDAVYVFTPEGRIIELPRGSSPVDFAYAIHSDVGNTCVAARVDRRMSPLSTQLRSGQTVKIITAEGVRPNPAWLSFVGTAKARSSIRHYLKNLKKDEAKLLGRRLLERELGMLDGPLDSINSERLDSVLASLNHDDLDSLLIDIGFGNRIASLVARHIIDAPEDNNTISTSGSPLTISGTEGMVVNLAKCCHPIPGDRIHGHVSAGRGLVIHHDDCRNITEFKTDPQRWVEVEWEASLESDFPVGLHIENTDQRGALAIIASTIAQEEGNIENVKITEKDDRYVLLDLVISVRDRLHLSRIIRRLRTIKLINHIHRT